MWIITLMVALTVYYTADRYFDHRERMERIRLNKEEDD